MVISKEEINSFEQRLYDLRLSIGFFNGKVERCVLHGMIDLTHKIESNIERLDSDISKIVKAQTTSIEEVRNIRLHDDLNDLKRRYDNIKSEFERECSCRR